MALTDFASCSGVLCPMRPSADTCPMPCLSWASSWLWFAPSVSNSARGKTEDSCIAFSSMVIFRSNSSARCIATVAVRDLALAARGFAVGVFAFGAALTSAAAMTVEAKAASLAADNPMAASVAVVIRSRRVSSRLSIVGTSFLISLQLPLSCCACGSTTIREPVRRRAQVLHQRDVFLVAVVVVIGDVAGGAVAESSPACVRMCPRSTGLCRPRSTRPQSDTPTWRCPRRSLLGNHARLRAPIPPKPPTAAEQRWPRARPRPRARRCRHSTSSAFRVWSLIDRSRHAEGEAARPSGRQQSSPWKRIRRGALGVAVHPVARPQHYCFSFVVMSLRSTCFGLASRISASRNVFKGVYCDAVRSFVRSTTMLPKVASAISCS